VESLYPEHVGISFFRCPTEKLPKPMWLRRQMLKLSVRKEKIDKKQEMCVSVLVPL
jgi:hypothetical protein